MRAEPVTEPVAQHAEGPVWHADEGVLHFVDMLAGDLLSFDPASGALHRRHVARVLAAVRPRQGGGLVAGVERGFALIDRLDGPPRILDPLWIDEGVRMNDGGCDVTGRFYCGSMAYDEGHGRGTLYRLDPDLGTSVVLTGVTISNGLAFSADGRTAYYVDSATQRVDVFDYEPADGAFTHRRPLAHIATETGTPDGLTVDAEGFVWVALFGGGAVHRYAPDGRLAATVEVDVPYVTACTFGGPDLTDLYITAARYKPDTARVPNSGALFRVASGTTGLPVAPFAG